MTESTQNRTSGGETLAAVVLVLVGGAFVSAGVTTAGALVSSQYSQPWPNQALWPLSAVLTVGISAVTFWYGMLILAGILGAYQWPRALGRNESFVAGVAGLFGVALALVASVVGTSATLNFAGTALPAGSGGLLAILAVAVPTSILYFWLIHPRHQPDSSRGQSVATEDGESTDPAGTAPRSSNPPSVWTEGNDPTVLGDRADSTRTGNRTERNQDSVEPDANPRTNPDDYQFHWDASTGVSMADVGGMEEIKRELKRDVILPLTEGRTQAEELGIPLLPNILFHGPPGTGKTFLAKALATELGLPFAMLSGADLTSKWINESPQKVATLFDEAKRQADQAGGAVVFIDELDTVLKSRDSGSGHDEDQKVVNEFLRHLQETNEHDILIIGATNRLDSLDQAATRAGRFDKKIHVSKPDKQTREAIIRAQLRNRPHALDDEQIEALAEATEGSSAAHIESIIIEAARECAFGREGAAIRWMDLQQVEFP